MLSAILDEKDAQDRNSINEVPYSVAGTPEKAKYNEEAAFFSLLASVFGMQESGFLPVLKEWPESTWRAWDGEQIYDAYAKVRSLVSVGTSMNGLLPSSFNLPMILMFTLALC